MALQTWEEHEERRRSRGPGVGDFLWCLAAGLYCAASWAATLWGIISWVKGL
jgi:hypothetical protein